MGGVHYPPTRPDHVFIHFEPPARPYKEIGVVSSIGGLLASDGAMIKKLQKAGADLGADAIIIRPAQGTPVTTGSGVTVVQSQNVNAFRDYPRNSAVAIKYE